jgi:hypothetical protein
MPLTIFECGKPPPPGCSVPGCPHPSRSKCPFELSGKRAGHVCGQPLCHEHGHDGAGVCPPHQRQIDRALAKGSRA